MESIILKIITSLISCGIYGITYLGIFIVIQFLVYQTTGISIVNKLMELVVYAGKVKIGG